MPGQWPVCGGGMGERIRSEDWAASPLGPVSDWPQSLKVVVDLMLASRQPACIVWGPELISLYNDAYVPILGDKHPGAFGRPFPELFPEVWDEYAPVIAAARDGEAQHFVDRPVALAGRPGLPVSWFTFAWTPIRDGGSLVAGLYGTATETTEKVLGQQAVREAEAAQLRQSEARFQTVVGSIDEGFCVLEMVHDEAGRAIDYRFIETNRVFDRQAGLSNVVGRTARELVPGLEDSWVQTYARVAETGEPVRFVNQAAAMGRWFDAYAFRIDDPQLRHVGLMFRDVTDRVNADERIRRVFEIKTVGVMFWGQTFGLTDMNDAFLEMTGFSREEALGLTWQQLTPPEFHADSRNAVRQVETLGESEPYEKQYYRKDGSRWWGLFAARKIGDEVVEFVLDVTKRREAEAELRRLNETLELRVAEEVSARMTTEDALRQSQKMEAIGQLTGGVAHDFNNLLTVIRSSADLLRKRELDAEKRRRYIDAIADTADRAAKLTRQLLAFARRQALKPEVFSIGGRVETIADMLRTVVGSRVDLVADTDCEICYVEADPTQFETALVNMAVNARDAMDGVGRLTIAVRPTEAVPKVRGHGEAAGAFVAVSVSDTGSGIPPDKIAQIFEPFFTTKEVGKGTGLGLSQVYGFAKQSGGEVDVRSRPGEGATFTLYLPRAPEPAAAADEPDEAADEVQHRGHVLVVEDNEQVGAFSTQMLKELGFETTWAGNADAALKLLQADPDRYAAVFSDVVMPGMSGVDLGREIQRRLPNLPVVLTSGYSHVLAAEGPHGFELLHKPYSAEDLTNVLRRAIGRRTTARRREPAAR